MTAYIVRRLIATLPVMAIVAICVFLLLHISPGDPAAIIAGDNATPANIEMIRKRLGLDEPLWKQFLVWVGHLLRGDLGQSMFWNTPVLTLVGQRYEPTLSLALTTLVVAVSIAVTLGVLAAWRVATLVDRAVMGFAVLGFSVPVFVVGYVLIYVFAIQLKWLPVQGYTPIAEGFVPWIRNLILPSIAKT
jgi:peptide/nickel transport system permease protein